MASQRRANPVPDCNLLAHECWIGLDLSKTTDLTSLVCLFPDREDESYDVLPFFWLPEDRVHQVQKRVHVDLEMWRRQGLLETTPGNVLDYAAVRKKIAGTRLSSRIEKECTLYGTIGQMRRDTRLAAPM